MTLNAEIAMSIEHKIHRVHYQTHHHHYHVHHLLTPRHQHRHNHQHQHQHHHSHDIPAILEDLDKPQDLERITANNHQNQQRHILLDQHNQQEYKKLESINDNNNQTTTISPISATDLSPLNAQPQPSKKIARCLTAAQIQRDQQLSLKSLQRRQAAAKLRQKSQIQFFIFAAFAYILSPIDLIPEVVFGVFGILDDLLFLFMCMFCIAIIIIYPIFREMRRTIFDKLGLKREQRLLVANKSF